VELTLFRVWQSNILLTQFFFGFPDKLSIVSRRYWHTRSYKINKYCPENSKVCRATLYHQIIKQAHYTLNISILSIFHSEFLRAAKQIQKWIQWELPELSCGFVSLEWSFHPTVHLPSPHSRMECTWSTGGTGCQRSVEPPSKLVGEVQLLTQSKWFHVMMSLNVTSKRGLMRLSISDSLRNQMLLNWRLSSMELLQGKWFRII